MITLAVWFFPYTGGLYETQMRVPWEPMAGNSPVFGFTENTLVAETTWAVNGTGFLQKHVTHHNR